MIPKLEIYLSQIIGRSSPCNVCNGQAYTEKTIFPFLFTLGYDRGDRFPLDFEPNGIPFGSKLKGKLPPRLYPHQCERKWK